MANTPSALKRVRQSVRKEQHNIPQVSAMRTYIKDLHKAVDTGEGDLQALLTRASRQIDRVAGKGLIHPNKANRYKARLAKLVK